MLEGLDEEGCVEEYSGQISEKKRRLSVDQVKALEKNFEVENKLEPERKVKLAQELGLQPRQVAVWFQNRRARWKTKQLERDYGLLKANYEALKHNYGSLQRDNETRLKEVYLVAVFRIIFLLAWSTNFETYFYDVFGKKKKHLLEELFQILENNE